MSTCRVRIYTQLHFSGATSELRECGESLARQRHQQTATDATATWQHMAMPAMSGGFVVTLEDADDVKHQLVDVK